jgi:hypothetical protein
MRLGFAKKTQPKSRESDQVRIKDNNEMIEGQKKEKAKKMSFQAITWGRELKRCLSDGESNPDLPRFAIR